MKKTNRFCLILFLLPVLCFSQNDFQPGFVILDNGDTVHGSINMKSNNRNARICEFRSANSSDPRTYTPEELQAYWIGDQKYYISKEITLDSIKKKVFLEYLVDGIADLYYLKDMANDCYFMEKGGEMVQLNNDEKTYTNEYGNLYKKNSSQYKGVMHYFFRESPKIVAKVDNTSFDFSSLIKITKDYHKSVCTEYSCIDYTKSTVSNISLEPFAGIIHTTLMLETSKDKVTDLKPYAGLNLRFRPIKGYHLWNLIIGLNFSSNHLSGQFLTDILEPKARYEIDARYLIARVPISVEYHFPLKSIQPFVSLGYTNIFLFKQNVDIVWKYFNYDLPVTNNDRDYQSGITASAGCKVPMKNSSYFFMRGEYEFRFPTARFSEIMDYQYLSSYLISAGYGINLH